MKHLVILLVFLNLTALGCASRRGPIVQTSAEELFHRGVEHTKAGDAIRAEQYLAAAISRGHPESEVLPLLLDVCLRSSRLSLALNYAEPYLVRHPDDWPLRFLVATIVYALGDGERAQLELERVLEAVPNEPHAHYAMALVLLDQVGKVDLARHHLRRYLALTPIGPEQAQARAMLRDLDRAYAEQPTPVDEGVIP